MSRYAIATLIVALFGLVFMSFFTGVLFGSALFGNDAEILASRDGELADDIAATRATLDALTERIYALEQAKRNMRGDYNGTTNQE